MPASASAMDLKACPTTLTCFLTEELATVRLGSLVTQETGLEFAPTCFELKVHWLSLPTTCA